MMRSFAGRGSARARAWLTVGVMALTVMQPSCAAVGAAVAVGGTGLFIFGADLHRPSCDSEGCIYNNLAAIGLMTIGAGLAVGGASVTVLAVRDD